jgi:hypothetical protein
MKSEIDRINDELALAGESPSAVCEPDDWKEAAPERPVSTSQRCFSQLLNDSPDFITQDAPAPADDQPDASPGIRVFYDGTRFLMDTGRDFVPMDRRSFKSHLDQRFSENPEAEICRVQVENFVRYAGPIAGHKRGPVISRDSLLLVTSGPSIIKAKSGTFPTIKAFLRALLGEGEHGKRQLAAIMGWLQIARKSLLAGKRRPGQALVLAGPIACGKTVLIKLIITLCLGGRTASPYRYLTGKTGFNGDLIGAEVLVIDDECGSTRIEARRALGDGIKNSLFAASVRVEAKHKNAFDVSPLWRLVIAVNDEPESLLVLPPLAHDLADKLMILRCSKAVPEGIDFDEWETAIKSELPAFLHAVESHTIAPEDAEPRCGIRSFWNPEIVAAVSELAPEAQLMQLIDAAATTGAVALPWAGTAATLKALLTSSTASTRHDAERLLGSWPAACGVYLARLEGRRVVKLAQREGIQTWRIEPGKGDKDTTPENQSPTLDL